MQRNWTCLFIFAAVLWLLASGAGWAATTPQPADQGSVHVYIPEAAKASPNFDPLAATKAYMAELSPAQRARSDAYFEGGYWLLLVNILYIVAVAWLLLGTRLSTGMRNLADRLAWWKWLRTPFYVIQYMVLTTLLTLPLNLYEDFFREHAYGLSNQTLPAWLGDAGKGFLVSVIVSVLLISVIYIVIRRTPRNWWKWGTVVSIGFMCILMIIGPVYIAPLFNHYKPLPDGPVKTAVLSMARANGVPVDNVYWFDASKQSKRISANVSGFLGTTRVSLNDNLLNRSSLPEIRAVMGHELGHYVLNHVYKGVVFFSLIIAGGFAFANWGFGWCNRRFGAGWGVTGIGDIAGLPLLIALVMVYFFMMTPVTNTITRSMESEADIFGLNAAREPDGFAGAALQLSEYRKMKPGPLEEFIFYDHPSGWQRIHMAMVWKSQHLDQPDHPLVLPEKKSAD